MIKLCVQYPASGGSFFDFDYYLDVHMPLSERLLSDFGMCGYEVQRCTTTISGESPEFRCITLVSFNNLEDLRRGMKVHGEQLSADFARYTDISPVVTVCEPVTP